MTILSRAHVSTKIPLYQNRKFHSEDEIVKWSSYFQNGIYYTGKTTSPYWNDLQAFISWNFSIDLPNFMVIQLILLFSFYFAGYLCPFRSVSYPNFKLMWWSDFHTFVFHDDVIKWKHFPRYWPFVRGIHRSPVNSPHKGQWRWRTFDVYFDLHLNKRLSKQSWCWWFETLSSPYDVTLMSNFKLMWWSDFHTFVFSFLISGSLHSPWSDWSAQSYLQGLVSRHIEYIPKDTKNRSV